MSTGKMPTELAQLMRQPTPEVELALAPREPPLPEELDIPAHQPPHEPPAVLAHPGLRRVADLHAESPPPVAGAGTPPKAHWTALTPETPPSSAESDNGFGASSSSSSAPLDTREEEDSDILQSSLKEIAEQAERIKLLGSLKKERLPPSDHENPRRIPPQDLTLTEKPTGGLRSLLLGEKRKHVTFSPEPPSRSDPTPPSPPSVSPEVHRSRRFLPDPLPDPEPLPIQGSAIAQPQRRWPTFSSSFSRSAPISVPRTPFSAPVFFATMGRTPLRPPVTPVPRSLVHAPAGEATPVRAERPWESGGRRRVLVYSGEQGLVGGIDVDDHATVGRVRETVGRLVGRSDVVLHKMDRLGRQFPIRVTQDHISAWNVFRDPHDSIFVA